MSVQPLNGTTRHAQWLSMLAQLVGREYDPSPGQGCWLVVRDGLRLLGAAVPDQYAEACGLGESLGADPAGGIRIGDVAMLRSRADRKRHVGLCTGDGRVLHTWEHGVVIERLRTVKSQYDVEDIIRLDQISAREVPDGQ